MDKWGVVVFAIIGILVAMIIVVLFPVNCGAMQLEGFASPLEASCPSGSKSMYDSHGDLVCCAGEINGDKCEGTILCTFSGNNTNYPLCNKQRVRKYMGPINPFIQQIMAVGFVEKFAQVLQIMANFKTTLQTLPKEQISPEDTAKYIVLLDEEKAWYSDNLTSDSIVYQEECMYIIQRLTAMFTGKPIMQNPQAVQQQVLKQMCSPK